MSFDIRQDNWDYLFTGDLDPVYEWIEALIDLFEESPEGQTFMQEQHVEEVGWAEAFMDMTIFNERTTIWFMSTTNIRSILYDHIPENIPIQANNAPEIIEEFKAFWHFLKREFELENADKMLKVLNEKHIVKKFEQALADESKYGMVKAMMMPAINAGIDITDEKAVAEYLEEYTEQAMAEYNELLNTPIPENIIQKRDEIIAILTPICNEHISAEYAQLAAEMAEVIASVKPESPFAKARANSWAAGIVYALGKINFLFDPKQEPHLSATDLCKLFGVSQQTASGKANEIIEGLELVPLDPDWTIESLAENNPWNMLMDSFMFDMFGFDLEDLGASLDSPNQPTNVIEFPFKKKKK